MTCCTAPAGHCAGQTTMELSCVAAEDGGMDERCHSLGQRCVCFKANQMRVVNIGRNGPCLPPHLKMTALSYSCTTFTTKSRETGRETTMRSSEPMVMMRAQMPGPSSQTANTQVSHGIVERKQIDVGSAVRRFTF